MRLREQMKVALGLWPMPPRTPINAVIHGKIDRDEYTVEKVFFSSLPGHYVSGNLYRPKNRTGPLPAVLCPHGHWEHGRFTVNDDKTIAAQLKLGAEGTRESAYAPQQARCAMLARMGCVVFHYDMVGYADSTAFAHRTGFNDVDAELRLQSFMGLQTWNSIRSLDFLISLPEVNPKQIAVTGESGGGTQTMILCAIDDRPAVSVPAVMVSTHMQGGCICENCSDLRLATNNVEFASLFAPRPLAMIAANDWTSDLESNGLPQIRSIYGLYNAHDKVTGKHFNFEHNYNQVSREFMYAWMNRWLNLGYPASVTEKPFKPLTPQELAVYDDEHPRPTDTADAAAIRSYMTATSDAQLRVLQKDPSEYRKVLEVALHAMVQDRLPATADIQYDHLATSDLPGGIRLKKGTLGRRGSGEQLPFVRLTPEKIKPAGVVLWVHPAGKSSLFTPDGKTVEAVDRLLQHGLTVLAIDAFATGELAKQIPATNPAGRYAGFTFAGYQFCYNRSLLGNRVHDLITAIAAAQPEGHDGRLSIAAFGKAGTWALLARAATEDGGPALQWKTVVLDLNGFDFGQVGNASDEMMLPGALKYGGIYGFLSICAAGNIACWNAPRTAGVASAVQPQNLELHQSAADVKAMINRIVD